MPTKDLLCSQLSSQSTFFLVENLSRGSCSIARFPALRQWFMEHLRGSASSMCPLSKGVRNSRRVPDYHMPVLVPIHSSAGVKGAGERSIPDIPSLRSKNTV